MNTIYVTALYNIYDKDISNTRLCQDVQYLLNANLEKLVIFVDDYFYRLMFDNIFYSNVDVILLPLEQLIIYSSIINNKQYIELPLTTTYKEKDTHEYIALMNSKFEFLYLVKNKYHYVSEYLVWIDAGINKLFTNKNIWDKITNLRLTNIETSLMPGCYIKKLSKIDIISSVWWNFSGSLFIVNNNYIDTLYRHLFNILIKYLAFGHCTWEVNILADIYQEFPKSIKWYYGNHDDSIINNIPKKYILIF